MRLTWLNPLALGLYPLALACAAPVGAADIDVNGHWSKTITRNDLDAGAGSDIAAFIDSAATTTTLDITNTGGASWLVRVASNAVNWPAGTSIAVRRAGNECGIDGGTAYLQLSGATQTFFSGTGDCLGIHIQLRVAGISIQTAPAPYILSITYSVQSPAP